MIGDISLLNDQVATIIEQKVLVVKKLIAWRRQVSMSYIFWYKIQFDANVVDFDSLTVRFSAEVVGYCGA